MYIKIEVDNFDVIYRNINDMIAIMEKEEEKTDDEVRRFAFDLYAVATMLKLAKLQTMVKVDEDVETDESRFIKDLAN